MRTAVVGAGIFGTTAAIEAARAGHKVELFERSGHILQAASAINQGRLHRGAHYPRSLPTAVECSGSALSFAAEYGDCIASGETTYAIAREGSRTDAVSFLRFCQSAGLDWRAATGPYNPEHLSLAVGVQEHRIDLDALRIAALRKLRKAGVPVWLNTEATADLRNRYDTIVIAAYAGTNTVAQALGARLQPYQFEVIEKPVVRLPAEYRDFAMVVLDGPFGCVDPLGESGLHVLGHVTHAIHAANTGTEPSVPEYLEPYLNRGVVPPMQLSRFGDFIAAGEKFIPVLAKATHIGSMFTIRAVLPERDADDARPTLVERLDEQVVRVFSGKIGTCVAAARSAVAIIGERERRAA